MAVRFAIFIIVLSSAAAGVVWFAERGQRPPDPALVLTVNQLETRAPAASDAADASSWQAQQLPHSWRAAPGTASQHRTANTRDYRLTLPLNVPPNRLWALFIPTLQDDVTVRLNGNTLAERSSQSNGVRNGVRSVYVVIPNGAIAQGDNELLLQVAATGPERGLLGPLYLGPASELGPYHQQRLQQYRLFWYSVLALLLLAVTGMVLNQGSRQDSIYRWFAAMCVLWAGTIAGSLLTDSVVPWHWLDLAILLVRIAFIGTAYLFCLNYINEASSTIRRIIISACVLVGLAVSALRLGTNSLALEPLLLGSLQLIGFYVGFRFLRAAWLQPSRDILSLAFAGVLILAFGIHSSVASWQGNVTAPPYLNYLTPLLFMVIGYVLIRRFTRVLQQAESLSASLRNAPAAVPDQTLGASQQQLLIAERERIMRDMHDGVGGHLVSSLSILRNREINDPDLEEILNQALVDLRLMIDSLDDSDGDLSGAIAMLKERTRKTLAGSGLEARWRIDEIRLPDRGPADTLQILRVLQEALTNVIKHAKATSIQIEAQMLDPQTARFTVSDNGTGFDASTASQSRGLGNMQQRADSLHAQLGLHSSEHGTELTLTVPNQRVRAE